MVLKHLAIQHLLDLSLQVLRVMTLIRKKMMIWIYCFDLVKMNLEYGEENPDYIEEDEDEELLERASN